MAKRYSKPGRRAGLFIGGIMFGLVRGIFFKNKYWGVIMSFLKVSKIDKVWVNICKHEGEVFYTVTNKEIKYVVKDNYIIVVSIPSHTRISKTNFEKALEMNASKHYEINIRGRAYIYGIITDSRIK